MWVCFIIALEVTDVVFVSHWPTISVQANGSAPLYSAPNGQNGTTEVWNHRVFHSFPNFWCRKLFWSSRLKESRLQLSQKHRGVPKAPFAGWMSLEDFIGSFLARQSPGSSGLEGWVVPVYVFPPLGESTSRNCFCQDALQKMRRETICENIGRFCDGATVWWGFVLKFKLRK